MPFFMFFIIKERKRYVKFALHQIKSAINFVFSKESLTFALEFIRNILWSEEKTNSSESITKYEK